MSEKNRQAKKNKRKMMKDSRELGNYNKRSARVYTPTPITSLPPILWPSEVVQKKAPKIFVICHHVAIKRTPLQSKHVYRAEWQT